MRHFFCSFQGPPIARSLRIVAREWRHLDLRLRSPGVWTLFRSVCDFGQGANLGVHTLIDWGIGSKAAGSATAFGARPSGFWATGGHRRRRAPVEEVFDTECFAPLSFGRAGFLSFRWSRIRPPTRCPIYGTVGIRPRRTGTRFSDWWSFAVGSRRSVCLHCHLG